MPRLRRLKVVYENDPRLRPSTATAAGGGLTNINVSAGTTSNNLSNLILSNSNNVSFGLNGSTITASASVATSLSNIRVSAGTTSNLLSAFTLSNSNNVSFGLDASTLTASAHVKVSAGTLSQNLSALTFNNGNGVSFGLDGSTITGSVTTSPAMVTLSSYENAPGIAATSSATVPTGNIWAHGFLLPNYLSASFMRLGAQMVTQSRTVATTASSRNASAAASTTWQLGLYSNGTGGSSRSMMSVMSTTLLSAWQNSISVAANGTQYTVSMNVTFGDEGTTTSTSSQYAFSTNTYQFLVTGLNSLFSAARCLDIPIATSLTPGNYWLVLKASSSTATNDSLFSAATSAQIRVNSLMAVTQANVQLNRMGVSSNGYGDRMAAGYLTTGALPTAFDMTNVESTGNHPKLFFHMLRSA